MNRTYPVSKTLAGIQKLNLLLILTLIASVSFAQHHDSSIELAKHDTLVYKYMLKADSIARAFQTKVDSLNLLYQSQFVTLHSVGNRLQSMIDSLGHRKLPVEKLTAKMDSLDQVLNDQINSLKNKTEVLKSTVTKHLKEIQLPSPMQEQLQKLQSSIEHYNLTSLTNASVDLPQLNLPDAGEFHLPSFSHFDLTSNMDNIKGINGNLTELAGEAGKYGQQARQLVSTDISAPRELEMMMEEKLLDLQGAEQLKEGTKLFAQTEQFDSAAVAEKINEMGKELVVKVAKNHFEGKQEVLQQAMSTMSKLKNNYNEVQSMANLPRRLPNPLKGKSWKERVVPAFTFQIQKSDYFLLDINPMMMYRIRPVIAAGVGWNQRLPMNEWSVMQHEMVYGPRAAFEVRWKKGIYFRLLPEIMNTVIPEIVAQAKGVNATYREWVGSLFIGIKKEYTVYRQIKGNTEVLYNLLDPEGLSPYGDRLSLRFGFDFPWKEKGRN